MKIESAMADFKRGVIFLEKWINNSLRGTNVTLNVCQKSFDHSP
jgi:hypothetical protein